MNGVTKGQENIPSDGAREGYAFAGGFDGDGRGGADAGAFSEWAFADGRVDCHHWQWGGVDDEGWSGLD